MLDVHPPHHPVHACRDFLIHIATIVVGLLIVLGLEQAVERLHHHHQVYELHQQFHDVFENNLRLESFNMQQMADFRAYHKELLTAVEARLASHPLPVEPATTDPRIRNFAVTPSLAPYDTAKQNGTFVLLPADEVRIYNRIGLQRDYLMSSINDWHDALLKMEIFEEQFTDSTNSLAIGEVVPTPNLSQLSPDQLREYGLRIAAVLKTTDIATKRIRTVDVMCRAVLHGAHTERELMVAIGQSRGFETQDAPAK